MSVSIEIDRESQRNIDKQFELLKKGAGRSMYSALMKVAFKIKSEAQLRLTGRGHIISSRLKNSMFVKALNQVDNVTYSDTKGKSYNADLTTVNLKSDEFAIGTNVEYAEAIEFGARPHVIEAKNAKVLSNGKRFFGKRVNHPGFGGDSYLYWSMKNVNIMQSVQKDMSDDLKFGKFLRPDLINTKSGKAMTGQ